MPRSVATSSRRAASIPVGVGAIRASQLQSPVPVVITLVPPRRRHRRRATAPALLVLEWLVLTTLGAVALALVAA